MIGYYGKEDRKLLQQIEKHLATIATQLADLISLQEEILAALQGQQVAKPAVDLKFKLGVPVTK